MPMPPASVQDALIHLMVVTASSDNGISGRELAQIDNLVARTPVFAGYDRARITEVANDAVDAANAQGIEPVLDAAIAGIPPRIQDTAYALAVEVAVVDLHLPQEELRFLEMVRDKLQVDRLVTAAIEASARARMRKA
jgi:hypothetical protein